jgi:hypothetical protein
MYEMSKKDKSKEMKEDKQTPSASAFWVLRLQEHTT